MLLTRVLTAAAGIPVIVGLILLGGPLYNAAAAALLGIGALEFFLATDPVRGDGIEEREGERRSPPREERPSEATPLSLFRQRFPAIVATAAIMLVVLTAEEGFDELTGALAIAIGALFLVQISAADPPAGLRDWTWTLTGLTYIGFLGTHLVLLRDLDGNGHWVLLAVLSTWLIDTLSYFAGRLFGRVHVVAAISPGKTLEGYIAGMAGGVPSVLLLDWALEVDLGLGEAIAVGLVLPPLAMIGDLAESLIKRGSGVKDTSELVPGHGGVLDRLDSLLFTVPAVYYFVIWVT